MKTENQRLFDYAMLANASYADLSLNNFYLSLKSADINAIQANYIQKNYNIISHWKDNPNSSSFSGTLFQNKKTGEYILALKGTKEAEDILTDITDLGLGQGLAFRQIVDLYNFKKLLTSKENSYTGIKLNNLSSLISRKIGLMMLINDNTYGEEVISKEDRNKYLSEIETIEKEIERLKNNFNEIDGFYIEKGLNSENIYNEISHKNNILKEKLPSNIKFTVVGHSLGGHLAMAFSRMFPELTNHVYTFNGAGFGNLIGNKVKYFFDEILEKENSFDKNTISSIIAYKSMEFVAMNKKWGLIQVGEENFSFTGKSGASNHSIKPLVDAMASISLISSLDKRFADLSLSEIFEPEGNDIEDNQTNAKPITKILESISYDDSKFFGLFIQKFYRQLTGYEVKINFEDKNDIYTVFFDLYKKFVENENPDFEKGSFKITAVHDIIDFVAKALSPEGYAYRYALKHLNSFVIEHEKLYAEDGVLKDELPSLKLYDPNDIRTEEGMTIEYILNRAKMLQDSILNILSNEHKSENIVYDDIENSIYNYFNSPYIKPSFDIFTQLESLISFGSNESNHLLPIPPLHYKRVSIFAGAGDDNIKGTKNGDYFEGGTGFDTYHIEGHDLIHDVDGKGKVTGFNMDEHFFLISLGVWETKDGKHIGIQDGLDLEIKEKDNEKNRFTIHNFFNPKFDQGDAFVHLNIRVEKEPERPLLEYEEPKHEKEYGAIEKNNSFFNHGEYVAYQGGNKTDRVTSSKNQGMIASLGKGSDIFIGNEKKDIAFGDDDNDVMIGANKNEEKMEDPDYIEGGKGKDLIYGGGGDDVLYAHSTEIQYGRFVYEQTDFSESFKFSDIVIGGFGDDKIFGSAGRDILAGGGHKDIIFGGAGADLILGDAQFLFNYKYDNIFVDGDKPSTNEYHYSKDLKDWVINPYFNSGYFIFKIKEESFDWSFNVSYDQEKTNYEVITKVPLKEKLELDSKGDTDYLYGGEGDDLMLGQKGNDFMFGADGDDIMFGDDNKDLSISGDDYMSGGAGNNQLFGGKGNDTYILDYSDWHRSSSNVIYDSEGNDTIDLSEFNFFDLSFYSDNQGNLGVIKTHNSNGYLVHVKNFISNPIENWIFKDGYKSHHEIQEYSYKDDYIPPAPPIDIDWEV